MPTKKSDVRTLLLYLMLLVASSAVGQGNIPKGYEHIISIIPPDTLERATDVFWPYGDQKYLFVMYGYDNPKILIVDTDDWKNLKWFPAMKHYSRFYGLADNFKILVLEKVSRFLFFGSIKYQFISFMTGETKIYSKNELSKYVDEHGKLDGGRSSNFNDIVLSPDRNYLIATTKYLRNSDDFRQKRFELTVFKYRGN